MAPPDVLIHYLVLFQRALNATERAAWQNDPDEMLFCGYLADALHNVPSMLRHYGDDRWNTPEWIAESVRILLPRCEAYGAPHAVLEQCRQITRHPTSPAELGLKIESGGRDLAPAEPMSRYLTLLKDFCLTVRLIRSAGEPPHAWSGLTERWDESARRAGSGNGKFAALFRPIPHALVHWHEWNEVAFWNHIWEHTREWHREVPHQLWEPY